MDKLNEFEFHFLFLWNTISYIFWNTISYKGIKKSNLVPRQVAVGL